MTKSDDFYNELIIVSYSFVFLPFGKYPGAVAVLSLPFCNPAPLIYEPI